MVAIHVGSPTVRAGLAIKRFLTVGLPTRRIQLQIATMLLKNIAKRRCREKKGATMLWTIFVILLVMWLLGMVSAYTMGGFIHILLVIALVVLLLRIISGRRVAL